MKKDIRNPNFFEGSLQDMCYKDGEPPFPDKSCCLYSHLQTRCSIAKKMWLNDVNDIFYFVTESQCKWELCMSLVVKAAEFDNELWIEGKNMKFLKKELKFNYPQKATHTTRAGRWRAAACRICRLPFENFSTLPDKRDQLIPVAIFAEGPKVPDPIYALIGRISLLEGTGRDVRKLIREAEATPGLRVLVGKPFYLQYSYAGSSSDDEIQIQPGKRKMSRPTPPPAPKRQASHNNDAQTEQYGSVVGSKYASGPSLNQGPAGELSERSDSEELLSGAPASIDQTADSIDVCSPTHAMAVPARSQRQVALVNSPTHSPGGTSPYDIIAMGANSLENFAVHANPHDVIAMRLAAHDQRSASPHLDLYHEPFLNQVRGMIAEQELARASRSIALLDEDRLAEFERLHEAMEQSRHLERLHELPQHKLFQGRPDLLFQQNIRLPMINSGHF